MQELSKINLSITNDKDNQGPAMREAFREEEELKVSSKNCVT